MINPLVSIPKGNSDVAYRYKRPLIVISTYGQGGNLKTKIENIQDLSKALVVPPEFPLKFIGYELGSQTDIKGGDYIISGKHTFDKLEELLEKFIQKYLLCSSKKCRLPEITMFVKNNQLRSKCRACSNIANLDEKHKIANYIKRYNADLSAGMNEVILNPVNVDDNKKKIVDSDKIVLDPKKIRQFVKKLSEAVSKGSESEIKSIINEVAADPAVNSPDVKYFIYLHGIYSPDIYETFEKKVDFLHYVSMFNYFYNQFS
jgi:translation initiation factor 2 beta subunit (eIF-2beta)/eIF-5